MMERTDSVQSDRLEAYLDHQMSQPERQAFERVLESDAELRDQVQFQGNVDQALRKLFVPLVPGEELIASIRRATPSQPGAAVPASAAGGKLWLMVRVVSVTAAVLLVWGWVAWSVLDPAKPPPLNYALRPLAVVYQESVEQGFEPLWVCEDDRQFASTFLVRQGQGLLLKPLPEGTQMVGLSYLNAVSRRTTTLMARVDGTPVMVFVDQVNWHRPPAAPSDSSGLHLYSKILGGVAIYELTPLDSPRVMDFLYPVDVPDPVDIPESGR